MKNTRNIKLPIGVEIKEEAKRVRRTFALRESVFESFKDIAQRKGTNANALLNDLLQDYVVREGAE